MEELQGWDIQFTPQLVGLRGRQMPKEKILMAGSREVMIPVA